jgi:hypothetical protein
LGLAISNTETARYKNKIAQKNHLQYQKVFPGSLRHEFRTHQAGLAAENGRLATKGAF